MRAIFPLAFYGAGGETLHDAALEQTHHHRAGRGRDYGRGEELSPRHLILSAEERDRYRNRLTLGTEREGESEEELVPAVDEGQYARRGETGHRQRKKNFHEALSPARAIDMCRFLEVARYLPDRTGKHPHRQRHCEGHVRHDETGIGVDEPERSQEQIERA